MRPALPLHVSSDSVCSFGEPLARAGLNDSSVEVGALTSIGSDLWVVFTKRPRGDMGPSWEQCTSCCWGVAKLNKTLGLYVPQALFPLTSPLFGLVTASQSLTVHDPAANGGVDWVYFCLRAPEVRVRADRITDLSSYERVKVNKPAAFSSFNRAATTFVEQLGKYVLIAEGREPHMGSIFASTAAQVEGACATADY